MPEYSESRLKFSLCEDQIALYKERKTRGEQVDHHEIVRTFVEAILALDMIQKEGGYRDEFRNYVALLEYHLDCPQDLSQSVARDALTVVEQRIQEHRDRKDTIEHPAEMAVHEINNTLRDAVQSLVDILNDSGT